MLCPLRPCYLPVQLLAHLLTTEHLRLLRYQLTGAMVLYAAVRLHFVYPLQLFVLARLPLVMLDHRLLSITDLLELLALLLKVSDSLFLLLSGDLLTSGLLLLCSKVLLD